jgi:DNA polymerase-3 subunit delta
MSKHKGVYLFSGEDEFPMNNAARQLINSLIPESEQAFGLEVVEGQADNADEALASLRRCQEALFTQGFLLAQGKVVWWRDVSFLADGQTAQADSVRTQMKAFVAALAGSGPGENALLITTPKADGRSALFKLCKDRFEVREFNVPEKAHLAENQARVVIRAGLKAQGLKPEPGVEDLILGRVGGDARQIACELEKLSLFVGSRKGVTVADVEAMVSTSAASVMWDLQDAVGSRNLVKALNTLHDLLAQKESPIGIVVSIFSRIRDLMLYREALDQGWVALKPGYGGGMLADWGAFPPEAEKVLTAALRRAPRSIHPFAAGKMAVQAQNYTPLQLRRFQRLVVETHEAMVSSGVPQTTLLELMLIRAMGSRGG